jgi:hypothetical protein
VTNVQGLTVSGARLNEHCHRNQPDQTFAKEIGRSFHGDLLLSLRCSFALSERLPSFAAASHRRIGSVSTGVTSFHEIVIAYCEAEKLLFPLDLKICRLVAYAGYYA